MHHYTLRHHPRSKHLRLTIKPGGDIIVTAPKKVDLNTIERFMYKQQSWIEDAVTRAKKHIPSPLRIKNSKVDYKIYKSQALTLVQERLVHFNAVYKFTIQRISIKNQKTRWGSCSGKGNINFTYKIALLPRHLADYIIVHELCHIGEFNHSQKFWDLVGKTIPEYRIYREELKRY